MDSYQPIYDAVRSKIGGTDAGRAIEDAVRQALDISHIKPHLQQEIYVVSEAMTRPSVLFRPTLAVEGDKWMALLGDNIAEGLAAFGDTPDEAMRAFDQAFLNERTPIARRASR